MVTSLGDDSIENRAKFDIVRYANCWEDADILVSALQPGTGKRFLSIASSGDNTLSLIAEGADVVAADLSTAQLACLELRCAAFRNLEYDDTLAFLGVTQSQQRMRTFQSLRHDLSTAAVAFWDRHRDAIYSGVIHMGKFENYFRVFRKRVLPLIHNRSTVARMLEPKGKSERLRFWNASWNNLRWRALLRLFFSRFLMARMGRDPEFFRYVTGSISDQIQRRARYAIVDLAPDQNPYLQYIAVGNYSTALPRYLRSEHYEAIRSGLDRLTIFRGPIEQAAATHGEGRFDGFNLSDIFEYVNEQTSSRVYGELLKHAKPSARLAYWNTFVPRSCPRDFADHVRPLDQLSADLFAQDKAFFYNHFQVDEVIRPLVCSL